MASWSDVRRIALALPETSEQSWHGGTQWRVKDKGFVWERPLRRADIEALGDTAPDGPILAARVADIGVKEALLTDNPDVFFTTPHFDGYPAIEEPAPVQGPEGRSPGAYLSGKVARLRPTLVGLGHIIWLTLLYL